MASLEGRGIVGLRDEVFVAPSHMGESTINDRVIWAGVTVVPRPGCIVDLTWIEKGLSRMICARNSLDVLI